MNKCIKLTFASLVFLAGGFAQANINQDNREIVDSLMNSMADEGVLNGMDYFELAEVETLVNLKLEAYELNGMSLDDEAFASFLDDVVGTVKKGYEKVKEEAEEVKEDIEGAAEDVKKGATKAVEYAGTLAKKLGDKLDEFVEDQCKPALEKVVSSLTCTALGQGLKLAVFAPLELECTGALELALAETVVGAPAAPLICGAIIFALKQGASQACKIGVNAVTGVDAIQELIDEGIKDACSKV